MNPFKSIVKRDLILLGKRNTEGPACFLLYGMMVLFCQFSEAKLNPSILFFFLFVILTQGISDLLKDEYHYGFLEMIYGTAQTLLPVLLSKGILWFLFFGLPLSLVTVFMTSCVSLSFVCLVLAIFFSITFVGLMVGALLLGATNLRGGLLILALPFYIPLYLALLFVAEREGTMPLPLLSLGILLFYVPLTLMIANKALKEAIHNK